MSQGPRPSRHEMEARALVLLVWLTKEAPGRPQNCYLGISWSMASGNESPFSMVCLDFERLLDIKLLVY